MRRPFLAAVACLALGALPSTAAASSVQADPVLLRPESSVACDGAAVRPLSGEAVPPGLYGQTFGPQTGQRIERAAMDFTVDELGRTRDIRGAAMADGERLPSFADPAGELVQATVAGWTFAPGVRRSCRLTIRYTPTLVSRADQDLLARYFAVTRTNGAARDAVARRLGGPEADCERRRAWRRTGYPDFRVSQRQPGRQDWTIVRWNVDETGRFDDVETLASSGDAALDAETREIARLSELEVGPAQSGCVYNWYRNGGVLPAPPMTQPPADPVSKCPAEVLAGFRVREGQMPAAFRARGVEGWALIRFDISPWGEVGSVAVIEAQPAAAFGNAALALVAGGRGQPGAGAVRCVQPIVFQIPEED